MAGKQASVLNDEQANRLLTHLARSRHPIRNRVIALLSIKAGLRVGEVSKLTWPMVLDAGGEVATLIQLRDCAAKMGSGRTIPMHPELRAALVVWRTQSYPVGPVVKSERGNAMTPVSLCNFFSLAYRAVGLAGCSSHSGRRTFITKAARQLHRSGGSLRDVQILAGHSSLSVTQRYIQGDTEAQRKLVSLV